MNKNIPLLSFLVLLSSCATLINTPYQSVRIDHDPGISVRVDTSKFYYKELEINNVYIPKNYTKQNFNFLRSRNELPLIINNLDTLILKPHRSFFTYWFGNIYMTCGLGMIIDYQNDKSFEYPIYNYIVKTNEDYQNIRFKPIQDKSLHFSLSIPTINLFYLQTDSGKVNAASGLGVSGQLEYFLDNKNYVSLNIGTTLDLFSPAPDSIIYFSHYFVPFRYYSSSNSLSLRFNKITPRIDYGIGISLSSLKWSSNDVIKSTDSTRFFKQSYYKSLNLGLSTTFAFRLTPNLNLGIIYQPMIFDIKRRNLTYQHFMSTQLIWRF